MKRAFDVLACGLFLLFFWPILLIVIIAIRLQSPGPAIFRQVRVGKNGRPFTCYKCGRCIREPRTCRPTRCRRHR